MNSIPKSLLKAVIGLMFFAFAFLTGCNSTRTSGTKGGQNPKSASYRKGLDKKQPQQVEIRRATAVKQGVMPSVDPQTGAQSPGDEVSLNQDEALHLKDEGVKVDDRLLTQPSINDPANTDTKSVGTRDIGTKHVANAPAQTEAPTSEPVPAPEPVSTTAPHPEPAPTSAVPTVAKGTQIPDQTTAKTAPVEALPAAKPESQEPPPVVASAITPVVVPAPVISSTAFSEPTAGLWKTANVRQEDIVVTNPKTGELEYPKYVYPPVQKTATGYLFHAEMSLDAYQKNAPGEKTKVGSLFIRAIAYDQDHLYVRIKLKGQNSGDFTPVNILQEDLVKLKAENKKSITEQTASVFHDSLNAKLFEYEVAVEIQAISAKYDVDVISGSQIDGLTMHLHTGVEMPDGNVIGDKLHETFSMIAEGTKKPVVIMKSELLAVSGLSSPHLALWLPSTSKDAVFAQGLKFVPPTPKVPAPPSEEPFDKGNSNIIGTMLIAIGVLTLIVIAYFWKNRKNLRFLVFAPVPVVHGANAQRILEFEQVRESDSAHDQDKTQPVLLAEQGLPLPTQKKVGDNGLSFPGRQNRPVVVQRLDSAWTITMADSQGQSKPQVTSAQAPTDTSKVTASAPAPTIPPQGQAITLPNRENLNTTTSSTSGSDKPSPKPRLKSPPTIKPGPPIIPRLVAEPPKPAEAPNTGAVPSTDPPPTGGQPSPFTLVYKPGEGPTAPLVGPESLKSKATSTEKKPLPEGIRKIPPSTPPPGTNKAS